MNVIPRLQARVFHRFLSSGRTRPCLFSCGADDSTLQQYAVKSYHQLLSGVIKELIAGLLGQMLSLPVSPIALIDADRRLGQVYPDLVDVVGDGSTPHFGSLWQTGGYVAFSPHYHSIAASQLASAFEIFAWDMLIQNPDRRKDNANLLVGGDDFVLIDHELALGFDQLIGEPPPPWQLRGTELARNHVFYIPLRAKITETGFDLFLERFAALSEEQLTEIVNATPPEWQGERLKQQMISHFVLVRRNLEKFRHGLLEVLT